MKKVITVRFEGEGPENCYDLKQWNYGITLRIEGLSLPEKVEVHFALDNSEMAQVYLGTTEDGVTTVQIPAFILENADGIACVSGGKYKAFAYIYQSDEESGWTVRKIIFHIEARQRPEDYIHTEDDLKTWEKLEKRIGEVDKKKLTSPQTAKVGQIFRIHAVNEDGTITLEAVDASECAVTDVTVDGQSILGENGVAEIPFVVPSNGSNAANSKPGVFRLKAPNYSGLFFNEDTKSLEVMQSPNSVISDRNYSNAYKTVITTSNVDFAVKEVMTDGKGPAWTEEEKAASRERTGSASADDVIKDIQIDGESIVDENGVAEIPMAKQAIYKNNKWIYYPGVVGINSTGSGLGAIGLDSNNALIINASPKEHISKRYNLVSGVITTSNYDFSVESAMGAPIGNGIIDGVFHYPAWPEETQAAARKRMGIPSGWELIEVIDITEDVVAVERDTTLDGKSYDFKEIMVQFISAKNVSSYASVMIFFDDNTYVRKPTTRFTGNTVSKMVAKIDGDVIDCITSSVESTLIPSAASSFGGGQHTTEINNSNGVSSIKKIMFQNDGATDAKILSGSKITIYARWK